MNLLFVILCFLIIGYVYSLSPKLEGGDGFIEFNGDFRIGNVDDTHFSVSSKSGQKTVIIFRNDGTVHYGPRSDYGLWDRPILSSGPTNVEYTGNGIEFGAWCLGISAPNHLSISHHNGASADLTALIWRNDGTRHIGPRSDFSCWNQQMNNNVRDGTDALGRDYIQFDNIFRIGQTANSHLSIVSTRTAVIYRSDGTVHPGPRDDFNWPPFDNC